MSSSFFFVCLTSFSFRALLFLYGTFRFVLFLFSCFSQRWRNNASRASWNVRTQHILALWTGIFISYRATSTFTSITTPLHSSGKYSSLSIGEICLECNIKKKKGKGKGTKTRVWKKHAWGLICFVFLLSYFVFFLPFAALPGNSSRLDVFCPYYSLPLFFSITQWVDSASENSDGPSSSTPLCIHSQLRGLSSRVLPVLVSTIFFSCYN